MLSKKHLTFPLRTVTTAGEALNTIDGFLPRSILHQPPSSPYASSRTFFHFTGPKFQVKVGLILLWISMARVAFTYGGSGLCAGKVHGSNMREELNVSFEFEI